MNISPEELHEMQRRLEKLDALEAGGVDNWEWYDESLKEWRKENEVYELIEEAVSELDDVLVDADVDQPAGAGCGYAICPPPQQTREFFARLIEKARKLGHD